MTENKLIINKHFLYKNVDMPEYEHILNNFCGTIIANMNDAIDPNAVIYLSGNIKDIDMEINITYKHIYVIKEVSFNYEGFDIITINQLPLNIHNVGIYFKNLFDLDNDYFDAINNDHKFQSLTESNKQSNAFRTGIYLTKVEEIDKDIHFNLMRCSSNFDGPTDNFSSIDDEILDKVNSVAEHFFEEKVELNHVLAQIYNNTKTGGVDGNSERKAKISRHSDKTKDMPRNALMAFCTFYKDFKDKNDQVLTRLRFRLKKDIVDPTLEPKFDIVLHPNSVFLMSLYTNRLYTHEIVPSCLSVDKLPTRMGYVIRCSDTKAVFKNDRTYINKNNSLIELEDPTEKGVKELKDLYYKENMTNEMIYYENFHFSLNGGDYKKPLI
jgi:hypothetical protein